jgi:hypothetical protein
VAEQAADVLALLAAPNRLRVAAAVIVGAATTAAIEDAAGLDTRTVATALTRLRNGGLVDDDGAFDEALFLEVARGAARNRPRPQPDDDTPVLRNFLKNGRLTSIPAQQAKRRVVLDFLAGQFEPGKVYPERDVNFVLGKFHADFAALRRYLVDEEFLERRDGFYWRAGGTFDVT